MKKHVYFVRHGQTDSNEDRVFRGAQAMLTDVGRAQAEAVAERIARLDVDALISSTFPRALETAAAIGKRIQAPIESNDRFVEWTEPSSIFGKSEDDASTRKINEIIFRADDPHFQHGDEETFAEMTARARMALQELMHHPAQRICVVTHGGFLRVLAGVMVFGDLFTRPHLEPMFYNLDIRNTGITYAQHDPAKESWRLVSWNDQAHLG